jgi:hypothetical protein
MPQAEKSQGADEGVVDVGDLESSKEEVATTQKTTKDGIVLVPQPSDDPEEPLVSESNLLAGSSWKLTEGQNWSFRKKHLALIVLIFETFFVKFTATFIVS